MGTMVTRMEQLITIGQTRTRTVNDGFMEMARKEAEEIARLRAAAIAAAMTAESYAPKRKRKTTN
jgi:hypothetical protein